MALGTDNMVKCDDNRGECCMCLGCVVRVELTGQECTTSLGTSLAGECGLGIPTRDTCGGYKLFEGVPGQRAFVERNLGKEVPSRHGVLVIPLRRCPVWSNLGTNGLVTRP